MISQYEKIARKLGIYFVTAVLLGISFSCVYALSLEQLKNQENFYLGILISLTVAIVNAIIGLLIKFITHFEGSYT